MSNGISRNTDFELRGQLRSVREIRASGGRRELAFFKRAMWWLGLAKRDVAEEEAA